VIGETLQDVGITGALNMKSILEDFKLPDIPEAYNVPLAIKNVAFGKRTPYSLAWSGLG